MMKPKYNLIYLDPETAEPLYKGFLSLDRLTDFIIDKNLRDYQIEDLYIQACIFRSRKSVNGNQYTLWSYSVLPSDILKKLI